MWLLTSVAGLVLCQVRVMHSCSFYHERIVLQAKLYGNLVPNVVAGLRGELLLFQVSFMPLLLTGAVLSCQSHGENCTLTPYVVYNMMHNPGNRREHRIAVLS